jgi:hypothetical protein
MLAHLRNTPEPSADFAWQDAALELQEFACISAGRSLDSLLMRMRRIYERRVLSTVDRILRGSKLKMTRNAKFAFLRRSLQLWGMVLGCTTTADMLHGQIVIPAGAAFDLGAAPGNTATIDVSSFNVLGSIFWDADSASQDSQVNDPTAGNPFGDTDLRDNLPTYISAGPGEQYGGVSGGWNYQRILAESGGSDFLAGVATTPPHRWRGGEVLRSAREHQQICSSTWSSIYSTAHSSCRRRSV